MPLCTRAPPRPPAIAPPAGPLVAATADHARVAARNATPSGDRRGSPDPRWPIQIHELVENLFGIKRLAVRCQPHQLVFARVDHEAREVSKGEVQHAEGVRKIDLPLWRETAVLAQPNGGCRPLADAIQAQDASALERAWENVDAACDWWCSVSRRRGRAFTEQLPSEARDFCKRILR